MTPIPREPEDKLAQFKKEERGKQEQEKGEAVLLYSLSLVAGAKEKLKGKKEGSKVHRDLYKSKR